MSSPRLKQLVYASSAPRLLDQDDLVDILRASRKNNPAVGVTGALLYTGGNFMQVLEGPAEAVDGVYARVKLDPRHRQVLTLLESEVEERAFPQWSMGFLRPEDLPDEDREATESMFSLTEPQPGRVHRLLASFRSLMPGQQAYGRI